MSCFAQRPISRILLINPPSGLYRRDDRCQSRVEDQTVRVVFPPIDLALLGAICRRAGAEPRVGDYPARQAGWRDYVADLEVFRPDAVLFNATAPTIDDDLAAARMAREHLPDIITIARGDLFEQHGVRILNRQPELDLALWGEVEENLERLVAGVDPEQLEALAYRTESGEIRVRPGEAVVRDLDALPQPARDLLDNSLYTSPETGNPITVIQANRGCPARCIFCPAGRLSSYRFRRRSPELIVEELRECVDHFGIREFLFNGDTFTLNKRWLIELCDRIVAAGLDVRWGCNSRVDSMDRERAEALRRAGCWVVAFGIESGDQEMLDRMKKGTTVEQAEQAVAVCRKAGLATHAFFIIGLPWETRDTLQRTLEFARRLNTDFFDINVAYPLPGTELHDMAREEGLIEHTRKVETLDEAILEGSYAQAALRSRSLSADELTRWRRSALLRLYTRPSYIVRTLVRAGRTGTLPYYMRAAHGRLKSLLRS